MTDREDHPEPKSREVSEVASFEGADDARPIAPDGATAGCPDAESGAPREEIAGPDALQRDGRPDSGNR